MSVPYICFRCRHRVNQVVRPLKGRSFVSLSSSSTKPDNTDSTILSADKQKKERTVKARDGKHKAKVVDSSSRAKPLESALESVNSMLERLFESTQRAKPDLPVKSRYSQTLNPKYVLVEDSPLKYLKDDLAVIQGMVDKDIPMERALDAMIMLPIFKDRSGHGTRSAAEKSLLLYNNTLQDLLFKVIHERVSFQGGESSAKLVEMVQVYIASDVMREQWWHMILWQLLAEVTKSRTISGEGGLLSSANSDAQFQQSLYLLSDVIQIWKIFAKTFGAPSKLSQISDSKSSGNAAVAHDHTAQAQDWEGFPSPEAASNLNRGLRPRFSSQFLYYFPKKAESPNTTTLAAAAAMTYVSLRAAEQSSIISKSLAAESKPFMDFVTQIISNTGSDDAAFLSRFSSGLKKRGIVPAVADQLYDEWGSLRQEASDRQGANSGKEAKDTVIERTRRLTNKLAASQEMSSSNDDNEQLMITEEISTNMAPTAPKVPLTSNLLRQAAKESDVKLALKLWKRQVEQMSTGRNTNASVFVDFLRTFFAVARPDCATEVWNTMCKHGYKPTTAHWITLLEGCKKTQDLASLKSIWRRMEVAEMRNTNQAWTVYISGLLYCKDWHSALDAVDNLVKVWKSLKAHTASNTTEASFITDERMIHEADQFTPSIVPINAAISGLLGNRKPHLAQQILTWAISENIKPDTTTFNILLRPAVRHDDTESVQRFLGEMKHHACNPDVVTFTILIDGIFRNPSSAFQVESPEAQQALIVRVFKDMQDSNIKATAQTYSTILDGLLHPKYFNLPAARAVLARMTDQGIRPTPHIYTILVTHYFSLVPPDLPAIDGLWRRIELENSPVDHIFYDRMIEGYGRVGAIDKMLAVLRRMPGEGKRPGWIALLGALRALAQAEEWVLVADLVRDVADEKEGLLRFGSRGWRGEGDFWDFVEMLRGRGLEMPGRGGLVESGEVGEEDGGEQRTVNSEG
ncbi:hypothetical protein MMC17_002635 [Xylographa soralifera]|nr:hypothetical protein [Xylographa soralifera]